MGSTASRVLRRRIAGLIIERIVLTALPLGATATLLWGGLPWVVRMGGLPFAGLFIWLTHRHGLRPGGQGLLRASSMLLGMLRHRARALPATQYEAPIYPAGLAADLVVISDLHITVRPDRHSLEQDAFDADVHHFVDGLRPALRPKVCLLAGDLTDTGSSEAWRRLNQRFAPWRKAGIEMMAVAGNHDVHYRRLEVAAERMGIPGLSGYLKALVSHPSSAGVCSHPADRTARRIARLCGRAAGSFEQDSSPADSLAPRLQHSRQLGADFLLLDSNQRPSYSPASQAIGYVGAGQLARAQAMIDARVESRPLYLVLHHHLIPPGPAVREQAFLTCLDAPQVLAFAERNQVEAVFHGHLHMPYIAQHVYAGRDGRPRRMRVVSCGSALYAAEGMFAAEVGQASAVAVQFRRGKIERLGFVPAGRVLADVDRRRSVADVRRAYQGIAAPVQSTKLPDEARSSASICRSMPATDSSI
jgi:3',5'-cyclic AMP phosphodiesterase CpdA